jgi:hypothetical protein
MSSRWPYIMTKHEEICIALCMSNHRYVYYYNYCTMYITVGASSSRYQLLKFQQDEACCRIDRNLFVVNVRFRH